MSYFRSAAPGWEGRQQRGGDAGRLPRPGCEWSETGCKAALKWAFNETLERRGGWGVGFQCLIKDSLWSISRSSWLLQHLIEENRTPPSLLPSYLYFLFIHLWSTLWGGLIHTHHQTITVIKWIRITWCNLKIHRKLHFCNYLTVPAKQM